MLLWWICESIVNLGLLRLSWIIISVLGANVTIRTPKLPPSGTAPHSRVKSTTIANNPYHLNRSVDRHRSFVVRNASLFTVTSAFSTKMMTITLACHYDPLALSFCCITGGNIASTCTARSCFPFQQQFAPNADNRSHGLEHFLRALRERDQRRTTMMMLLLFHPFHLPNLGAI